MNDDDLWRSIREAYAKSGASVRRLAGRYGVPESTLRKRATDEGWQRRVLPLQIAECFAAGMEPLDYLLAVMRDEAAPLDRRCDAAKAAAPYMHRKMSR